MSATNNQSIQQINTAAPSAAPREAHQPDDMENQMHNAHVIKYFSHKFDEFHAVGMYAHELIAMSLYMRERRAAGR